MNQSASFTAKTIDDERARLSQVRAQAIGATAAWLKGVTSNQAQMLALSDDEYWMCIVERATD